ncbi:MAG: Na+/H+ antiporter NhaA [Candidatus Midichloria sp.]|nr:MAG: Na+/H+ antiporter NhaA [Candidatus Midichloria sp.]
MTPKRLTNFALLIHNTVEKGLLLFIATFLTLIISNSSCASYYEEFFQTTISLAFAHHSFGLSIREWINELLMAIFFFSVGMEIKRELMVGHLSKNDQRILPLVGAIGGVIFPIIIFILFNKNYEINMRGWAIPAATDIAFTLGVLALCGKGLPVALRVFLIALTIIDDLIAVLIIAFFYTDSLQLQYLWYVSLCVVFLAILCNKKIFFSPIYLVTGIIIWGLIMASGIHATIAGVIIGLLIPITATDGSKPIENIEKNLYPLVAYIIVPIFAFANSGVNLSSLSWKVFCNPIVLGITLGLFVGKQLGIFGTVYFLLKTKIASLPENINLKQFYSITIICGIGFTMSLFIGILAFDEVEKYMSMVKIGVLSGSLLSFIFGTLMLKITQNSNN